MFVEYEFDKELSLQYQWFVLYMFQECKTLYIGSDWWLIIYTILFIHERPKLWIFQVLHEEWLSSLVVTMDICQNRGCQKDKPM